MCKRIIDKAVKEFIRIVVGMKGGKGNIISFAPHKERRQHRNAALKKARENRDKKKEYGGDRERR